MEEEKAGEDGRERDERVAKEVESQVQVEVALDVLFGAEFARA